MKRLFPLCLAFIFATGCSEKDEEKASQSSNTITKEQRRENRNTSFGNSEAPNESNKTSFRNSYAEKNWPEEEEVENEWTREFKAAATPEEKIEVLGRKQANGPEQLSGLIRASLKVPNERVRIEAAQSIVSLLEIPEDVPDLVMGAVHDTSSEVRAYAMESVNELLPETKLKVYESTIAAPDYDVRKTTIVELGRIHTKPAFDVLMTGLQSGDAAFREEVNFEIKLMVNRNFESYEEATSWWQQNTTDYSDNMIYTGGIE